MVVLVMGRVGGDGPVRSELRANVGALVALLVFGCSSGSGERAEGAWGKAEDGLRAMLFAPRATVTLGEPLVLRVRVQNLAGEIASLASAHDLTLKVTRGDKDVGDDVDYVTLASEAVKLSPGEQRDFALRQYATGAAGATFCKERGVYRFRGRLGKLELPPVEVRVE